MVIPIFIRLRYILFLSIILAALSYLVIKRESKSKNQYDHLTGRVKYFSTTLGNLPTRDSGLFRYLQIDTYPYPFELYTDEPKPKIDELKKGDRITVYFYETNYTAAEGINNYGQFIDKDNVQVFAKKDMSVFLSWFMGTVLILLCVGSYVAYKMGKIPY